LDPVIGIEETGIGSHAAKQQLEQISLMLNHLTGFSRLLARQTARRGLDDRKGSLTTSSGRENLAFGGPNPVFGGVAALARCPASRCAPRLSERPDLAPSSGST